MRTSCRRGFHFSQFYFSPCRFHSYCPSVCLQPSPDEDDLSGSSNIDEALESFKQAAISRLQECLVFSLDGVLRQQLTLIQPRSQSQSLSLAKGDFSEVREIIAGYFRRLCSAVGRFVDWSSDCFRGELGQGLQSRFLLLRWLLDESEGQTDRDGQS